MLQNIPNFNVEEYIEEQLENTDYEWILVRHFDDPNCTVHGNHYHIILENLNKEINPSPTRETWYRALDRKKTGIQIQTGFRTIYEAIKYLTREKRILVSGSPEMLKIYSDAKKSDKQDQTDNQQEKTLDEEEEEYIVANESAQGAQLRTFIQLFEASKTHNGYEFLRWVKNQDINIYRTVFDHVYAKSRGKFFEWVDIAIQDQRDNSMLWTWRETMEAFEPADATEFHTIARSRKILHAWCEHNKIDVWDLAEDIKQIVDKEANKINAILFEGESNAGKTILANSITDAFYRSSATVNNATNCGFTWEKAVNARIIKHEEATMINTQTEEYKQILGGEPCMVNVKNKPMERLQRTPLIMTGNHPPWITVGERQTYENRCIIYEGLKSNSALKDVYKRIHPKVWLHYVQTIEQKRAQQKKRKTREDSEDEEDTLPDPPKRLRVEREGTEATKASNEANNSRRSSLGETTMARLGAMDEFIEECRRNLQKECNEENYNGGRHKEPPQDAALRVSGESTTTVEERDVDYEQRHVESEEQQTIREADVVPFDGSITIGLRNLLQEVESLGQDGDGKAIQEID